MPEFATQLAAMIGIGVGIDYALFIVTRYRQGLHDGLDPEAAVVTALDTAGRAVLFAGTTVVISLLGMLLIGIEFVGGLGVGAAAVVAVTMLASITLLPAVLGFVGRNIDKLKLPGTGKMTRPPHHRRLPLEPLPAAPPVAVRWRSAWSSCSRLALPVFVDPARLLRRQQHPHHRDHPPRLRPQGRGLRRRGQRPAAARGRDQRPAGPARAPEADRHPRQPRPASPRSARPGPTRPTTPRSSQVIPTTSSQDQATVDLIEHLRDDVIPEATAGTDIQVHVGGVTATFDDVATKLQGRLPLFIGVVLGLSFLLLLVVFRSIVVPLKAVVMNLLSIGAAYGVMVAVFQWGWGKDLIGVGKAGPIESFLPMMMFAILFGLSMDYEVFLLSRIKEEYDRNGDNNREAVADGLASTARVITAAAAIMVCVFGGFVFGDQRVIKEFGLGLAFAVFIDATLVRMILVPATMELLGDANWWFPKWLGWLPKIHIDGKDIPVGAVETIGASDGAPVELAAADEDRRRQPVG